MTFTGRSLSLWPPSNHPPREPGAANNPPGKIQMFITKSRHEREMRELRELLSDRTDAFVKDRAATVLQRDAFEAKFKKAITDLEREIRLSNKLSAEIAHLRPDATLWRNARDRRANKRTASR